MELERKDSKPGLTRKHVETHLAKLNSKDKYPFKGTARMLFQGYVDDSYAEVTKFHARMGEMQMMDPVAHWIFWFFSVLYHTDKIQTLSFFVACKKNDAIDTSHSFYEVYEKWFSINDLDERAKKLTEQMVLKHIYAQVENYEQGVYEEITARLQQEREK